MQHVAVISGGLSDERDVSLRSGQSVAKALQAAGYEITQVDPADGWERIVPAIKQCDVAFIALHGKGGEDGTIQKQLELVGIKYTGSDIQSSDLCFDKYRFWELMEAHHIATPRTELVDEEAFRQSKLLEAPYVLKPNDGGSSIDTFIIHDPAQADMTQLLTAFSRYPKLLLQEFIAGTEITVAILGDNPLPVIEIIAPTNEEFDYLNKYNGASQELCPPQHVSVELQDAAQKLAHRVHALTGCRDVSRTDMIIDKQGQLSVLEINTIPGFTDQSLLPKAAAVGGFDMPTTMSMLVQRALEHP